VFALQGAALAIKADLDLLGVMVLSFVAALGGGVARDVLIGDSPPQALRDWRYPALAILVGGATFLFYGLIRDIPSGLLITLDAVGLGMAAMAGAEKSLNFGLHPFIVMLIGGLNGSGGGVVRDILLNRPPVVLHADIYATAAMAGALVMIFAQKLGLPAAWAAGLGFAACVALRLVSVWQHWNLPHLNPGS
jgi:uncharacterized membrane protein YeiH